MFFNFRVGILEMLSDYIVDSVSICYIFNWIFWRYFYGDISTEISDYKCISLCSYFNFTSHSYGHILNSAIKYLGNHNFFDI